MRAKTELFSIALLFWTLAGCGEDELVSQPISGPLTQPVALTHVGSQTCKACHQAEFSTWMGSHHQQAMQVASADTVTGDFDSATFEYAGVTSQFTYSADEFRIVTDGSDGSLTEYAVRYTFGVEPLQQYLLDTGEGRYQALSIVKELNQF